MRTLSVLSTICLFASALPMTAQPDATPAASSDYEELPELKASEILRPEILKGPHHQVREAVPTFSGANQFGIDSEFGVFEAEGNQTLLMRINEINAIALLKEISRTDEFKNALVKAAKSPVAAAKAIVTDPVHTATNIPKGVMKFMGRIGDNVKHVGEKHEGKDPSGTKMEQLIGFSNAKRKVALSLGVDPYSTNTVLQHELDGIAWASFAGGATFSLATMPIGGGAATALTVTDVSGDFDRMLREKSPADLKIINRKMLIEVGANESEAEKFLNSNSFSPSSHTAFVLSLKSMSGVANRRGFVRLAGEMCSSEPDAIFCVQTAALMSKVHHGDTPLARIETFGDFPVCVAKDGTTVIALQWDYAGWTAGAADFSKQVRKFAEQPPRNKKVLVAISGDVSPRLRQEMGALNHTLKARLVPGPLR